MALVAFAANSVLCRLALEQGNADAGSFTTIRLASGWATLSLILWMRRKQRHAGAHNALNGKHAGWLPGLMLWTYATAFSYAYLQLDTATGALILFTTVQMTMLIISVYQGHRLRSVEWVGSGIALSGFIYLMLPHSGASSLAGLMLMTVSGIAWGIYSLLGQKNHDALAATQRNFFYALPACLLLPMLATRHLDSAGVVLAILSGALASGGGYVLWYAALTGLTAAQAAGLQLLVPLLAATGGVLFAGEPVTLHLTVATALIFSGILLLIREKRASPVAETTFTCPYPDRNGRGGR